MSKLSPEYTAYAVTILERLFKQRELNQKALEDQSGIAQSEISRILSRQKDPTKKELESLFEAMGLPLSEVVSNIEALPDHLLVYVATPLTELTKNPKTDRALRQFVAFITRIAADHQFKKPDFRFYWPGHHTHPVVHSHIPAKQVYITDRSRSSSYDLVVMLCASASCGIGQENEIATQAGVPAIRLIPEGFSRMMTGSFLQSWDIPFVGLVENGITFDQAAFLKALEEIRKLYFVQQALFRGIAPSSFGERLRQLVDDRVGSHKRFAEQVGIDPSYLQAMFTEPFIVCNPSGVLLMRMARVLNVGVGHLLCETPNDDAVFSASLGGWKAWVRETDGLDARTALAIRENWAEEYQLHRYETLGNPSKSHPIMTKSDWNALYTKCRGSSTDPTQIKKEISQHIRESRIAVAPSERGISSGVTVRQRAAKKAKASG